MSEYLDRLGDAMDLLAQEPNSVFLGQSIAYPGTGMYNTFKNVPKEKLIELPVVEDLQMGLAIGMALEGALPICVYPRINFLFLAMNQLILHLDKIPIYSDYRPKVIIRTAIGAEYPLYPGAQHVGNYNYAFSQIMRNVHVHDFVNAEEIIPAYKKALDSNMSTLIVEYAGRY